jgi:hypothetical protein
MRAQPSLQPMRALNFFILFCFFGVKDAPTREV